MSTSGLNTLRGLVRSTPSGTFASFLVTSRLMSVIILLLKDQMLENDMQRCYSVLIAILRGLSASALGSVSCSTPLLNLASTLLWSIMKGSSMDLLKLPFH